MALYVVPTNLDLKIFVGDAFQTRCLNIIHYLALRRKSGSDRYGYVNIHSDDLKHLVGGNYRIYIKFLIQKCIIQKNNCYCNNEMSRLGKFSKSYRLALSYSQSFRLIELKGNNVKPRFYDYTAKSDPICVELAKNCCRITSDYSSIDLDSIESRLEAFELAAHLQIGSANVKRGNKVKRIYHRINKCSKLVRAHLQFEGKPIVEYDMKSAHPVLALFLYDDVNCNEAQAYKELLRKDIYSVMGIEREQAKKLLRKFFYSKKHGLRKNGSSSNCVANFFRLHFPILFSRIVNSINLSVKLQNCESYFFNDFIVPKAHELGLLYISIHDGFICSSDEAARTISHLIQSEFKRLLHFIPEILIKNKNYKSKPPPTAVSYPYIETNLETVTKNVRIWLFGHNSDLRKPIPIKHAGNCFEDSFHDAEASISTTGKGR